VDRRRDGRRAGRIRGAVETPAREALPVGPRRVQGDRPGTAVKFRPEIRRLDRGVCGVMKAPHFVSACAKVSYASSPSTLTLKNFANGKPEAAGEALRLAGHRLLFALRDVAARRILTEHWSFQRDGQSLEIEVPVHLGSEEGRSERFAKTTTPAKNRLVWSPLPARLESK